MSVYRRKNSTICCYKFRWRGELIRRSTRQSNYRVALEIEAAHRGALAKGEVGIKPARESFTLKQFSDNLFVPYVEATFTAKTNTRDFYKRGVSNLLKCKALASATFESIATVIPEFVGQRLKGKVTIRTVNCDLEVLRRMMKLAVEWGTSDKAVTVRMLAGENHRDRVLTSEEESRYFAAAKPLLKSVATLLLECGMRPDECFRLRRENVIDGSIQILRGKTGSARRRIPMSPRVRAIVEMQLSDPATEWVFPAPTKSGHVEKSTLRKQHTKACNDGKIQRFPLYTFRHTCLTRWAVHMDAFTLAYLAGHTDFSTTKRYVHPQDTTVRAAMDRAHAQVQIEAGASAGMGHSSGHTAEESAQAQTATRSPSC